MGKKKKNCYNKLLDDLDSIEGDLKKLDALIVKLTKVRSEGEA